MWPQVVGCTPGLDAEAISLNQVCRDRRSLTWYLEPAFIRWRHDVLRRKSEQAITKSSMDVEKLPADTSAASPYLTRNVCESTVPIHPRGCHLDLEYPHSARCDRDVLFRAILRAVPGQLSGCGRVDNTGYNHAPMVTESTPVHPVRTSSNGGDPHQGSAKHTPPQPPTVTMDSTDEYPMGTLKWGPKGTTAETPDSDATNERTPTWESTGQDKYRLSIQARHSIVSNRSIQFRDQHTGHRGDGERR